MVCPESLAGLRSERKTLKRDARWFTRAIGCGAVVGGAGVEPVARGLVEGGLVVLEGVEVMAAGERDDQRRFFWL
jgi:hypothetical protein